MKNSNNAPPDLARQHGAVLVELSITIMLLLLLFLVSIDMGRLITLDDQAAFVARVTGASLSRECLSATNLAEHDSGNSDPLKSCLSNELLARMNEVGSVLPDFHLIASTYRKANGSVSLLAANAFQKEESGQSGYRSYSPFKAGKTSSHLNANVIANHEAISHTGTLVVVEAYAHFTPVVPFHYFFGGSKGRKQYVVALY